MTYILNPHKHVKIWLSNSPDVFLNQENQLRLVKMRAINPKDIIHFVYSSNLLSSIALNDLHTFCSKHKIIAISLEDQIIPAIPLDNIDELNLITIYQQELSALGQGGNLAAASDALRWLKGIYQLGIYSDLDVIPNTSDLSETIEVQAGILSLVDSQKLTIDVNMVIGSTRLELEKNPDMKPFVEDAIIFIRKILEDGNEKNIHAVSSNNDVIAVVGDDVQTNTQITRIQQAIFTAHQGTYSYVNDADKNITRLTQLTSEAFANIMRQASLQLLPYATLIAQNQESMAPSTNIITQRQTLLAEHEPIAFCHALSSHLGSVDGISEEEKLNVTVSYLREKMASFVSLIEKMSTIKLKDIILQKTLALLNIQDDKEFLRKTLVESQDQILISSVVTTTGAARVQSALFNDMNFATEKELEVQIMPHSLKQYGLAQAFQSHNSVAALIEPVNASEVNLGEKVLSKSYEVGTNGDQSWAVEGARAVNKREATMHTSALQIQSLFRGYRDHKALQKLECVSLEEKLTFAKI